MSENFTAFLLGHMVRRSMGAAKTPVAYLYNGVRLPELPGAEYPYATLALFNNGGVSNYIIIYTPYRPYRLSTVGFLVAPSDANEKENIQYWMNVDTETEWGEAQTNSSVMGAFWSTTLWANYDVLNDDGSVYLAKSDPIPVYE